MCSVAGIRKKTAHCLRVTCATSLFNAGVDEKLIRERTGHRSNALFQYEKANREQVTFDKCNVKLVINSTNCDNM